MELVDVPWNPSAVRGELQRATKILSERGLKLAAKWAVEQWMGLAAPPAVPAAEGEGREGGAITGPPSGESIDPLAWNEASPVPHYAKALMDLGEYGHAASVLSLPATGPGQALVERGSMPPPLPDLSPAATYLRAYCLYMAGERRKDEDGQHVEQLLKQQRSEPGHHHKTGQQMVAAVNPYLQQLVDELAEAYDRDGLDAFGLYVFGTILRAAAAPSRPQSLVVPRGCPSAPAVLMESLLRFPCNWSAWLELAECAGAGRDGVEREIEATLQPVLASHFCYALFCAHLQSEHHQAHHEALGLYERWLDPTLLGGSPYLQTQYGVVHYHLRQFDVAKRVLQDVHSSMPYRLEGMDVYSNILYVQQDSVALSQLAHAATVVDKYRPETCCIVGNYYSVKQMRAKAILYFQRALKLDPSFTSAWTLMGHEYVEWKQTAHAIECYRRAVQADAGDYRAWYGLGQTYEFLNMPLFSLFYYKRAVQLRPYDARMWCAVGTTLASLHRRPDAIRAYERAVQTGDTEGVATQKLAALYRNDGDAEKAARCYLRHLELRHHATHPNAAAAAAVASSSSGPAMPSLSSSSGAGATLSLEQMLQGLAVEATEAEAILYLANYHKNNNEFAVATVLCTRLLEYPGPEKEEAKAMLRELRSISSFPAKRRVRPSAAAAAGGAGSHPASRGHGGDRPPPPSGSLFG